MPESRIGKTHEYAEKVCKLRALGWSDERVAMELRRYLPGNSNPSAVTILRWRHGHTLPHPVSRAALDALCADVASGAVAP